MINIYIEHMGCSRRALDAEKIKDFLIFNGLKVVKSPRRADKIIFITCAFKKELENAAIERIEELYKLDSELIVTGCLPGINPDRLASVFKGCSFPISNIDSMDYLLPSLDKSFSDFPDVNRLYPLRFVRIFKIYRFALSFNMGCFKRILFYLKKRVLCKYYYIRIGKGCVQEHCSYCAIWRAVGNLYSKPINIIKKELSNGLKDGYRDIMLVADNPGAWGVDIGVNISDLLKELLLREGYDLHIEDIHPFWIIKNFDKLSSLFSTKRIKTLLIPIQSGSNRILKLMNRRHTVSELKDVVHKIRKLTPHINLYTSIMIGFPSETEEDFDETIRLVEDLKFSIVNVYSYSQNPYLEKDYLIKNRVSSKIKKERLNKALKIINRFGIGVASA